MRKTTVLLVSLVVVLTGCLAGCSKGDDAVALPPPQPGGNGRHLSTQGEQAPVNMGGGSSAAGGGAQGAVKVSPGTPATTNL